MMPSHRILIIDRDPVFSEKVRELLREKGFTAELGGSLDSPSVLEADFDALVIEAELDGMDVLKGLREQVGMPILVTSARDDVEERIRAFEAGADDILVKPLDPRELAVRLKTRLRRREAALARSREPEPRVWSFAGLTVPAGRRRVLLDGRAIELTTAEFDLLRLLASRAPEVLSRELLLEELRGVEWESVDRSIDILISRLRDKLGDDPRKPRFIRTVRSAGYQFIGEPLPA